jgi:phage gp37-like protein
MGGIQHLSRQATLHIREITAARPTQTIERLWISKQSTGRQVL